MTLAEYLAEVRKRADDATPVVLDEEQYRVAYLNGGLGTLVNEACCRYVGPNHGEYVARVVNDAVGIAVRTDIPLLLTIIEEQAKALEHFKTLDGHGWRVAGEAQTRIDALIAKGEK